MEHYNEQKLYGYLGPSKSPMWTILMLLLQRRFSYIGDVDYTVMSREEEERKYGGKLKIPPYFAYSVLSTSGRAVLAAVPKPPPLVFLFSMVGSCHHKGGVGRTASTSADCCCFCYRITKALD